MFDHERSLVESYEGKPFALLGVNVDRSIEDLKKAQQKYNLNWRSWFDGQGGPIARQWGAEYLPTLVLIDHKGVVRWRKVGVPDMRRLDVEIEKLVQEAEAMRQSS